MPESTQQIIHELLSPASGNTAVPLAPLLCLFDQRLL
jgi:hypothetical protein